MWIKSHTHPQRKDTIRHSSGTFVCVYTYAYMRISGISHLEPIFFRETALLSLFQISPRYLLSFVEAKASFYEVDKEKYPGVIHVLHWPQIHDSFVPLGSHFQPFSLNTAYTAQAVSCSSCTYNRHLINVHRFQLIFHVLLMPSLISFYSRRFKSGVLVARAT